MAISGFSSGALWSFLNGDVGHSLSALGIAQKLTILDNPRSGRVTALRQYVLLSMPDVPLFHIGPSRANFVFEQNITAQTNAALDHDCEKPFGVEKATSCQKEKREDTMKQDFLKCRILLSL